MDLLLKPVDRLLDRITSYRLVLYSLYAYVGLAVIAAAAGKLPFHWYQIVLSTVWLLLVCRTTNELFSRVFKAPRNQISDLITALILALILSPAVSSSGYLWLALAGLVAMTSKYIIVITKRHIFNPAAFGAVISGLLFSHYASWWVGTAWLLPATMGGGFLISRKIKRLSMVGFFIVVSLVLSFWSAGSFSGHLLWELLAASPLIFLSTIMLTEPLTSPVGLEKSLLYAAVVSVCYSLSRLKLTPEEGLLIGNAVAYVLYPYKRYEMKLIKKVKEAEGIYSFIFKPDRKLPFRAGQYMEWTLPLIDADSRGNRRYLTIASAPNEKGLMVTLKFPKKMSSLKQQLAAMQPGQSILATQLAGSFVLPKTTSHKLTLVAGGVGITPFHSMVKQKLVAKEPIDATLIYHATRSEEVAFKQLWQAAESSGLKTIFVTGEQPITAADIKRKLPDYKDRLFYISGPYGFVQAWREALRQLAVDKKQIITDYFPGYG